MAWKEKTAAGTYKVRWRDGSGRKRSRSFTRSRDADRFLIEQERREQLGTLYDDRPETFGEFAGLHVDDDGRVQVTGNGWFERNRRAVRTSTFDRRAASRKHLEPFISLRLDRIGPTVVDDAVTMLASKHPRQAQLLLETVKMILRDARVRGQRVNEDVLQLRAPKYEGRERRFLTSTQVEALAYASAEPHLIRVAAYTGLRQGELCALRDEDLDMKNATLRVTHTLYKGSLGRLKTKAARRSVPLPPIVLREIREQLLYRPKGTEYVFPAPRGGPWDRAELSRRFKTWASNAQLEGIVFHDLRHTFASLAIKAGSHPKVLQELMGHETWQVTMDTYGHLFPGQKETAMNDLNQLLVRETATIAEASSS
jgi:integrase